MNVTVVGLGKIGLPLAVQVAGAGHHVVGLDIDPSVIAAVEGGAVPFPGEPELDDRIRAAVAAGTLMATMDVEAAASNAAVVVIVVPLVVDADRRPDFRALDGATAAVAPHLSAGVLVIYETTLPVGTTRGRFAPDLEARSGRSLGRDLFVCHSPERVSSGRVFRDLRSYPKLVGGIDEESARRAVAFYESALTFDERADLDRPNGVWDLGSAEAAELAKLAETTYRDLNIAYANELAVTAERWALDVAEVIGACNSQPFSHIHQPGIAVGGHCIPVYPHFLLAGAPDARLPIVAREVNSDMPRRYVDVLEEAVGGSLAGATVVVLGLSYRAGVKEHAFSGAFDLVADLEARSATALVHDPLYTEEELRALGLAAYRDGDPCDGAILQAAHFRYIDAIAEVVPPGTPVMDGRGVLTGGHFGAVRVLGLGRHREEAGGDPSVLRG